MWLGGGEPGCYSELSTPCSMVNCRSTFAAASWAAYWARALMSGSVAVTTPGECMVGSEECVPAGPECCIANGGN